MVVCSITILPGINYNTIVYYAQVYACHTPYSVLLHQFVLCNYAQVYLACTVLTIHIMYLAIVQYYRK